MPWKQNNTLSTWEHQKSILEQEFPMDCDVLVWVIQLLEVLSDIQENYARLVYKSKDRDDFRGVKIIPDYKDSHISAAQHAVVMEVQSESEQIKGVIPEFIAKIKEMQFTRLEMSNNKGAVE
mmetsp:Transcript_3607/g.5215  ORF Transcript_3607/g.5215 Transcript_3607/m.5215 type:complete len:122 (+) Transcript_3607:1116-1481(+)